MPTALEFDLAAQRFDAAGDEVGMLAAPLPGLVDHGVLRGGALTPLVQRALAEARRQLDRIAGDCRAEAAICRHRAAVCRAFDDAMRAYERAQRTWIDDVRRYERERLRYLADPVRYAGPCPTAPRPPLHPPVPPRWVERSR